MSADDDVLEESACTYGHPGEKLCRGQFFQPEWCCGERKAIGITDRPRDPEMST